MSAHDFYHHDLSYHFMNLALVGEVQPVWESEEPDHADLDNVFAIPRKYYPEMFLASATPIDDIYDDIHGYVRDHYDFLSAIRMGDVVEPDYQDLEQGWDASQIESFDELMQVMSNYSRRMTESVINIRYNFSRQLMGYALRAKDNSHGLIVMRGTVSVDEWLNNVNYRLMPFHLNQHDYGLVHSGFRSVYKGVRGRYRQILTEFEPDMPLYLVGHSLGAVLSQMAALDIAIRTPERAEHLRVYAYAPPRLGDHTFAETYHDYIKTSYRIVNICDTVPYVPFSELGRVLNQTQYDYADIGTELAFVHQAGNPVANHVASYHLATQLRIPAQMDASRPRIIPPE